jgi:Holliday junction resolvase RusA-like endonuclease
MGISIQAPATEKETVTMALPSMADPPFGCPPDIVLDIPVPPSVNSTRRINWAAMPMVEKWKKDADGLLTVSGQYRAAKPYRIAGQYELTIIFNEEKCSKDLDNPVKAAIDYLRRLNLIEDDSPRYARQVLILWGHAPEGCRLIVRPVAEPMSEVS